MTRLAFVCISLVACSQSTASREDSDDDSSSLDSQAPDGTRRAPLTYTAPTALDLPLTFTGANHTGADGVYHPDQTAPDVGDLVGANRCVTDPDFRSKICRVTDANLGASFSNGAAGGNIWAVDASAFLIRSVGGAPLLFAFSADAAMTSTPTSIGRVVAGGDATHFADNNLTFSSIARDTMYELVVQPPIVQLNKVTIVRDLDPAKWTLARSRMFDFMESNGKCLPLDFRPNWSGVLTVSNDDTSFQISFSDHGQNGKRDANHPYGATLIAAFDVGKGCRVLNTYGTNGVGPMTITGDWGDTGTALDGTGAAPGVSAGDPLPDTLYLHGSGPMPNGTFSAMSGSEIVPSTPENSSCTNGGRATLCENYFWETKTRNVRPVQISGHSTKGYRYMYKGKKYAAIDPSNPTGPLTPLLAVSVPVDQHGTYNNADNLDRQPVFLVSSNVCGQATGMQGQGACDPAYTAPLYDEVFAVENQASQGANAQHCNYGSGPTGCIYRFAHTFNTGTNWNFFAQNAEGVVSPNGRFMLFPSDWNFTLGCTNGAASDSCLDNITASANGFCAKNVQSAACRRSDVFVVRLR